MTEEEEEQQQEQEDKNKRIRPRERARGQNNPLQKCVYLLILRILEYFFLRRKQIKVNLSNVLMF